MIVVGSGRGMRLAAARREHGAQRFLGAGLADRARDRDDRAASCARAPPGRGAPSRRARHARRRAALASQRVGVRFARRPPPRRPSRRPRRRSHGRRGRRPGSRRRGRRLQACACRSKRRSTTPRHGAERARLQRRDKLEPGPERLESCVSSLMRQAPAAPRDGVVIGKRQHLRRRRSGRSRGPCRRRRGRRPRQHRDRRADRLRRGRRSRARRAPPRGSRRGSRPGPRNADCRR